MPLMRFGLGARVGSILVSVIAAIGASIALAQSYSVPEHKAPWPGLATGTTQAQQLASLEASPQLEQARSARWQLEERRRMDKALAGVVKNRKGVVDVYVLAVGLDSDPVFGREVREAAKLLSHRYGAKGRTMVLAGSDGTAPSSLPMGSIANLSMALAQIAELMDVNEDVLLLYTSSHGSALGLSYHDGDQGFGLLTPGRLTAMLNELGFRRRMLFIGACFSGVFVPHLQSPDSAILTAASATAPSFGCQPENEWTYFGDALINHAMRKPQPLKSAADEAKQLIGEWERREGVNPSNPQISIGAGVDSWLRPLEAGLAAKRP